MNIIKTIIVVTSCICLFACSKVPQTTLLPHPIIEVTDGKSFSDGGSIFINFVLEDGSKWNLWFNKKLQDKNNPEAYKALTLSQEIDSEQSEGQIKNMKLEIGSKEEYEVLSSLNDFKEKFPAISKGYRVDSLLGQKEYQPNE